MGASLSYLPFPINKKPKNDRSLYFEWDVPIPREEIKKYSISEVFTQDHESFIAYINRKIDTLFIYCCSALQWHYDESFNFQIEIRPGQYKCKKKNRIRTVACFTKKNPFVSIAMDIKPIYYAIRIKLPQSYPYSRKDLYLGIKNSGSTCYMSSVLQVLFHIGAFRQLIYSFKDPEKELPASLQNLFVQLQISGRPLNLDSFITALGGDAEMSNIQQDAQEFLTSLIDKLETDLGKPFTQAISQLFEIKVLKLLKQKKQNSKRKNFASDEEIHPSLSFDISHQNESFENRSNPPRVPRTYSFSKLKDNAINSVNKMKEKMSDTIKKIIVDNDDGFDEDFNNTAANIEYEYEYEYQYASDDEEKDKKDDEPNQKPEEEDEEYERKRVLVKIKVEKDDPSMQIISKHKETYITLPITVDGFTSLHDSLRKMLEPVILNDYEGGPALQESLFVQMPPVLILQLCRYKYSVENHCVIELSTPFSCPNKITIGGQHYVLFAVVAHSGSPTFGHYLSFIRIGLGKKWYAFDDSNVSVINKSDVKDSFELKGSSKFRTLTFGSPHAYIVFYVKTDSMNMITPTDSIPLYLAPHKTNRFYSHFIFYDQMKGSEINQQLPPVEWADPTMTIYEIIRIIRKKNFMPDATGSIDTTNNSILISNGQIVDNSPSKQFKEDESDFSRKDDDIDDNRNTFDIDDKFTYEGKMGNFQIDHTDSNNIPLAFSAWAMLPGKSQFIGPLSLDMPAAAFVVLGHPTEFFLLPGELDNGPVFLASHKPPRVYIDVCLRQNLPQIPGYDLRYKLCEIPKELPSGAYVVLTPNSPRSLNIGGFNLSFPRRASYSDVQTKLGIILNKYPEKILLLHNKEPLKPLKYPYVNYFPNTQDLQCQILTGTATACSISLYTHISLLIVSAFIPISESHQSNQNNSLSAYFTNENHLDTSMVVKQTSKPIWFKKGCTCKDIIDCVNKEFFDLDQKSFEMFNLQCSKGNLSMIRKLLPINYQPKKAPIRVDLIRYEVAPNKWKLRSMLASQEPMCIEVRLTRNLNIEQFEGIARFISINKTSKVSELINKMQNLDKVLDDVKTSEVKSILFVIEKVNLQLELDTNDRIYDKLNELIKSFTIPKMRACVAIILDENYHTTASNKTLLRHSKSSVFALHKSSQSPLSKKDLRRNSQIINDDFDVNGESK